MWSFLLFWMVFFYTLQNVETSGNVHIQFRYRYYACPQNLRSNDSLCANHSSSLAGQNCSRWIFFCLKEKYNRSACVSSNYSIPLTSYCNATLSPETGSQNHFSLYFSGSLKLFDLFVSTGINQQSQPDTYDPIIPHDVIVSHPFPISPEQRLERLEVQYYEISFFVYAMCDQHYYGDCDKYCKPDRAKFNCSEDGRRSYERDVYITANGTVLSPKQKTSPSTLASFSFNTSPIPPMETESSSTNSQSGSQKVSESWSKTIHQITNPTTSTKEPKPSSKTMHPTNTRPRSTKEPESSSNTIHSTNIQLRSTKEPESSSKTIHPTNAPPRTTKDSESSSKTTHSTNTSPRSTKESESSFKTIHPTNTSPRNTKEAKSSAKTKHPTSIPSRSTTQPDTSFKTVTIHPTDTPPRSTKYPESPSTTKHPTNGTPRSTKESESSSKKRLPTNTPAISTKEPESSLKTIHLTNTQWTSTKKPELSSETIHLVTYQFNSPKASQFSSARGISTRSTLVTTTTTSAPITQTKTTSTTTKQGQFSKAALRRPTTFALQLPLLFIIPLILNSYY